LSEIEENLTDALTLLEKNEEVRKFLRTPHVAEKGKRRAVEQILRGKVHPALLYFLLTLIEQNELPLLKGVAAIFFEKASLLRKKIAGELVSSRPLSGEKVEAIEQEVGRIVGRHVHLRVRLDPGILGGIAVQVGDFVLDGTIDHQLEDIRQALFA